MTGKTIGKYRVLDRLGRGGMGTVYRAMDETLHRDVAIKILNAELNDPEIAKRFRTEAITIARLSHPGIATIYELFEHEGEWLMVMEYVRGETLEGMVSRMGPLSPQRSAELCMQTLAALAHAHSMGVVHRDLKPANLMITENGTVKVMDFGIARVSGSEHLTNAGFMMGTPAYMAPEQVKGADVDARADLYAMGVVFYRLTTAALPFKGDTPFAMVQSQVNDPPTPIGLVRADLPGWVEEIVTRALAKAPEQRFQSAAEFHEAFARCLAGLPLSSMRTTGSAGSTGSTGSAGSAGSAGPTGSAGSTGPTGSAGSTGASSAPTMAAPGTGPGMILGSTDSTRIAGTGPTTGSAGAAGSTGSGPVAPAEPAAPVAPAAPVEPAEPVEPVEPVAPAAPVVWLGIAGAALVAVVAAAYTFRGGSAPAPAPTPAATSEATLSAPGDQAAAAVTPPQAVPVTSAAAPPSTSPATSAAPPAGRRAATTSTSVPASGTAAAGAGAAGAAAVTAKPADDALVTFADVKLYHVSGKRAADTDAVLNFAGGQLLVMPKSGGAAMATLPYKRITHATYVHARDPKWDPTLASPPDGLDVGSFIRTPRHWLVLQGADHFEILRLEDNNFSRVLDTFEARTGVKIDRQK